MMKKEKELLVAIASQKGGVGNPSLRYCWPVSCITAKTCVWRLWTVTPRSTASP